MMRFCMKKIAVILAAGRGTRMKSSLNKVLHPILGRSMVGWSIDACRQAELQSCVVVGYQGEQVRKAFIDEDVSFATQDEPRGTGHAVLCALESLPQSGLCVVMCGDTPLFRGETLIDLVRQHEKDSPLVTVLTTIVSKPASYGRIVRDDSDMPLRIVEAANATAEELCIQEINTGTYVIDLDFLNEVLPTLPPHPPKQEIYLTDVLEIAAQRGRAKAVILQDEEECSGVNDRIALAQASQVLQKRIVEAHMKNGVSFEDPDSVTVERNVVLEQDVYIERGVVLRGNVYVQTCCRIGAYSVLENSEIQFQAQVHPYSHIVGAQVGEHSSIGPYARLREGTVLEERVKIGNFVETKKANMKKGSKASHLTYLGDVVVGTKANIGAGTITCNYDGFAKHKTNIGSGAFIGSNTSLVAPVNIGAGSIIGAGSTITKHVEENAIGVTRAVQRNIEDGANRFRVKRNS
jgi:bifunctional UDP-N-acetylglucosamine pyrophosphorylase / glucosamine-1-phosphate N-acetyltransferase